MNFQFYTFFLFLETDVGNLYNAVPQDSALPP